jgi:PAS domain S-box-containing protein
MGESTLGHDFSDRLWFKDARAQRQPVVSELILGRIGVFAPITVIAVPVIRGDQFLGTAGAALNLKKVQDLLQPYSQGKTRVITLSDFHNRIIASTAPERTPMQVWERKKTGVYQPLNAQMYHWYPDDPQLPSMTRWKQSFYVQEISLAPELPWKLFIEAPVAPLQQTLYAIYVKNLAIMALLMTLALFFSLLVSRTLTRPLAQLSRVTADLPGKLFDVRNLDWPGSSSLEINALIANAKSMAQTMEENFHNLQSQSNELRQSLSLQNATLESTADGILVVNLQGKIVSSNKKFREMWRIPEEIVNAGDDEQALAYVLQQLADPPSFLAKVGELYAQPAAESFDLIHFQDGRVFERYSIPQYLDEQIVGRVWSFRDVTTRTLVEEALYQSEAKYRALVETTATGYVIIDSQGQVLDANPEYVRLSGHRTQEEIIRRKATEWIAPHDQERYGAAVAACAAQGFVRHLEIDYLGPGGRVLPVEINATCLRTGDDYKILSLVHDITDRKQDEAGRLQVSKLESLATLAGGIAHDFNNILTAIMGNIGLAMLDYQRGEHNRARLQEAEKACLQAKTLARQLLTFAKGGAPVKELVSLGNIIAEAVSFASRGSQVKCDLSAAADLWAVEADPGQISQVFQNLVINAVQAMPTGGTLEVLGENLEVKAGESQNLNPGRYVKISFQDQGIGIPEEYLPKIFDPYFTTKQTGSGLGLATAYSIVKSHQGHLGVESRLGKGAVFQVYLPASEQAFAPPVVDEGKVQQGQGRILVMDDEDMVRKLLGDALSFLGYEACFAGEGKEALKLFLEGEKTGQNFDAVILDLTVPAGMGGKETLGELLKINPRVKVIVSSGYSEDPVMAKFEEYGFAGVIAKPYRVSEISKVLHAVIGKVT